MTLMGDLITYSVLNNKCGSDKVSVFLEKRVFIPNNNGPSVAGSRIALCCSH